MAFLANSGHHQSQILFYPAKGCSRPFGSGGLCHKQDIGEFLACVQQSSKMQLDRDASPSHAPLKGQRLQRHQHWAGRHTKCTEAGGEGEGVDEDDCEPAKGVGVRETCLEPQLAETQHDNKPGQHGQRPNRKDGLLFPLHPVDINLCVKPNHNIPLASGLMSFGMVHPGIHSGWIKPSRSVCWTGCLNVWLEATGPRCWSATSVATTRGATTQRMQQPCREPSLRWRPGTVWSGSSRRGRSLWRWWRLTPRAGSGTLDI